VLGTVIVPVMPLGAGLASDDTLGGGKPFGSDHADGGSDSEEH